MILIEAIASGQSRGGKEKRFLSVGDTFEEAREAMEDATGLQIPNSTDGVSIAVWDIESGEAVQSN